jgi:hypothetical protein
VIFFMTVNLCGIKWVSRAGHPDRAAYRGDGVHSPASAPISRASRLAPGHDVSVVVPFPGWFGEVTSLMAGLYLIGFAAPAFEAAACHVGETVNPNKNVPRAMLASGAMAACSSSCFPRMAGTLGAEPAGTRPRAGARADVAPVFGSAAKAARSGS